jgi:hypothetical protein
MKRIIRLTESDLKRIILKVIKEQEEQTLYGPEGEVKDFCKPQRAVLLDLLNGAELPAECSTNDEDACAFALGRIAYKKNMSGETTKKINLNSVRDAGYSLFKCNKENEPTRGPQTPQKTGLS